MSARMTPYLGFRDNAREAMTFYHSVFGGELTISTFAEYEASEDPSESEKVMHAQLETPDGFLLMSSDTPNLMEYTQGDAYSVSLTGGPDEKALLSGYWERLVEGGTVTMPLDEAPWGDVFGMCRDRFGVNWMVNIAGEHPEQ